MLIETDLKLSKMKTEICVKCKKEIPDDNENRYYQERTLEPLCSDCAMEIERQMFM